MTVKSKARIFLFHQKAEHKVSTSDTIITENKLILNKF